VFLHTGIGSAGEWKQVFSLWPASGSRSSHSGRRAIASSPSTRTAKEFLVVQQARGDLWDVLFDDALLAVDGLADVTAPVHLVEGSETSAVDHALCDVVRRHVPHARHTLIEGAGPMMPLTPPEALTRALLSGIDG
jgi:pimeloyl-ACP methyl ester carboxylesterase